MRISMELFPIDILKLIYEKKISIKEAEEIENFWRDHHPVRTLEEYEKGLLLTHAENNAFNIGLVKQLARWRYEGWPKICPLCKKKLVIEKWGLMYKKVGNRIKLVHIDCSDDYLRMLGYTAEEMGDGYTKTKPVSTLAP